MLRHVTTSSLLSPRCYSSATLSSARLLLKQHGRAVSSVLASRFLVDGHSPPGRESSSATRSAAASSFSSIRSYHNVSSSPSHSPSPIHPSLRQRRPLVNGQRVAFHINDLLPGELESKATTSATTAFPSQQSNNEFDSDLVVILDMDECLIHSQFLSSPTAAKIYAHQQLQQQQQQQDENSNSNTKCDSFQFSLATGDVVHVTLRPGLGPFLQNITQQFETHIFTAAMPIYAEPLLDRLQARFQGVDLHPARRWYRDQCTFDAVQQAYIKDLSQLPPIDHNHLHRVVLVDNNPLSFLANPSNGILVNSFYNDPTDTSLESVQDLLYELDANLKKNDDHNQDKAVPSSSATGDVRPLLTQRFGLEQALKNLQAQPPQAQPQQRLQQQQLQQDEMESPISVA